MISSALSLSSGLQQSMLRINLKKAGWLLPSILSSSFSRSIEGIGTAFRQIPNLRKTISSSQSWSRAEPGNGSARNSRINGWNERQGKERESFTNRSHPSISKSFRFDRENRAEGLPGLQSSLRGDVRHHVCPRSQIFFGIVGGAQIDPISHPEVRLSARGFMDSPLQNKLQALRMGNKKEQRKDVATYDHRNVPYIDLIVPFHSQDNLWSSIYVRHDVVSVFYVTESCFTKIA